MGNRVRSLREERERKGAKENPAAQMGEKNPMPNRGNNRTKGDASTGKEIGRDQSDRKKKGGNEQCR